MAKHKAATEVTVAPLVEKSGFDLFVSRYWFHLVAIALIVTGGILFKRYSGLQEAASRDGSWATLNAKTTPGAFTNVPTANASIFTGLAGELQGTAAGPWARALEVNTMLGDRDYTGASQAVDLLIREYPNHPLVAELHDFGDGRPPRSLAQDLADTIEKQRAWEASHTELFSNPPAPEGSPRVLIETDQGGITVELYSEAAPQHAQAFLSHCEEGFYDGIKFHEIVRGSRVLAGDPNSRDGDPSTWGMGGPPVGPGLESNDLYHFEGALASIVELGGEASHGSLFMISFAPAHELDGTSVVFGQVVEGMDIVRQIGAGTTGPAAPQRPTAPATITSTTVL